MKKQELLEGLKNCNSDKFTIVVDNTDMKSVEFISFFRDDFSYKYHYIDITYNDNLELKRNPNIKIINFIEYSGRFNSDED